MNKQKICIIGGSLTGLITAISLSKLNCHIDLITGNAKQKYDSGRTIAISQNNFNFLNSLKIKKSLIKEMWPCSSMKIYTEAKSKKIPEIFELNNNNNRNEKILYLIKNSTLMKLMMERIKNIKSITIKNNIKISKIYNSGLLKSIKFDNLKLKYNLLIICTGSSSDLIKKYFSNQIIENSYNENSATTILSHKSIKNCVARQIFLDNGILAFLPISNTKTSVVWSVKKNVNLFFKKEIKFYANNFFNNIKFETNIKYNDLNFLIRKKYYQERILLFGDALHVIHPFVGQGFNMVLRDLACLEKILKNKINLGLDVGSSDILSEFSNETKSSNFVFSIGTDLLKNSFSIKNKYFKGIRNDFLKILNKNNAAKNIFRNIADKGLKF